MTESTYRIQGNTGEWEVVIGLEVHAQVTSEPLGLQIIGKALDEQAVLNAGLAIEQRSGFTAEAGEWW